jgi:hypothetical protein
VAFFISERQIMAAPPALTELADTYPLPSNATFKGGITKLLNFALGLLGNTGNAAEARVALGIGPVISYRNLMVNGTGAVNQRVYVSGTNTTTANQVTLDRWRVVTSGQNITFGAAGPDRTITAPAGGVEQVIEAGWIEGGVYTLSWSGTATATVNGAVIANGAQTSSLTANTAATIRFSGGTFTKAQFELGTVATPFERRPPTVELLLCQRDYAKSYAIGTTPGAAGAPGRYWFAGNAGSSIAGSIYLPVPMRAAPTVTLWDGNGTVNCTASFSAGGVATAGRSAGVANITDHSFEISATVGSDVVITGQWSAGTGF